jgi:hypothetical protein
LTPGNATDVRVSRDRIYVADGSYGLLVLLAFPAAPFTVRINATAGASFTLEAATSLVASINWTPLLTTNVSAMPYDYMDVGARPSETSQKFYRVRQP